MDGYAAYPTDSVKCKNIPDRDYLYGNIPCYTRKGSLLTDLRNIYPMGVTMNAPLIKFIKDRRRSMGLTQKDLADRAGVGLRFIRDLEQGKESLRMDKVNQVLMLFGHRMEPVAYRMAADDEEG